ncbi:SDR family oxidoreductase [Acinetobacter ursingii]|uniref:SDR family oxidoreductase n=1 Tax=Acinetobacter ursingii TaxID=108980 RepID=A0AA46NS25_9GAMM|nr:MULTISPECIES: SDR family oxidoreductase [Acinetobacter]MCU4482931.1 SDR family oxidoreductase [Acinetobacter ursingii]MCU4507253.1 SDR family oxidoreductase [Acinetobacter ursingii]MCU4570373.1 SDR family oxidoreductase [Acinetobacter ursingii]MEC6126292.1 SDR family oxidoreductase [Acinetobacter ursingii]UYF70308.1 SDR family oxidoreductase [Acinetobacter ursingii]
MARKVFISAGGSGIGRCIAEAFLKQGDDVFVCDINQQSLQQFKQDYPQLQIAYCDLGQMNAIQPMFETAMQALGGLDILVNNTGISGPTVAADELSFEDWTQVLNLNLNSTFMMTKLAIPYLKQSDSGVIINLSSIAGRMGYPFRLAYSTSKWGIIGFTKTLSMELGAFDIRVNAVLPGAVDGERVQRVLQARADAMNISLEEVTQNALANQSLKQFVNPKHIADLCVFLASDSASSISGQILPIDGDKQRLT